MVGLLFSALTLAVGADTSNQYTELFRRADSAFEAEFKDSIDMAKMTREEAISLLKNRKVYVNGNSAGIQLKLFELGWQWLGDGKNVINEQWPFIFIEKDMHLLVGNDMLLFKHCDMAEISDDEIFSIEIQGDCHFKPFDKVLVRCDGTDKWKARFFDKMYGSNYGCTDDLIYKRCIKYEGNEHLHDTTDKPEDKGE